MAKKETWQDALIEAIEEAGSMNKLAKRIGCSHVAIVLALQRGKRISAEMAVAVARETSVAKHRLRPDLWEPEA